MNIRRLTLLLLSAMGLIFILMGLFNDSVVWLVIGFIVTPLGLVAAMMARSRCSSCNAYLANRDETICHSCDQTLTKHLPRLAVQLKR